MGCGFVLDLRIRFVSVNGFVLGKDVGRCDFLFFVG